MLNLAVRMVPLETVFVITRDPHLAIDFSIVRVAKIYLTAEVTFFVRIVTFIAKFAEADPFLTPLQLQLYLRKFRLKTLLRHLMLFSETKTLGLLRVKRTAELIVARLFLGKDS